MVKRSRFAPVTTGPSSLLDLAAGYFFLVGLFPLTAGIVAFVGGIVMQLPVMRVMAGSLTLVAYGVSFIWVGKKLGQGEKVAGFIALALTVMGLIKATEVPVMIWGGLSLLVIASIWRNLD